VTTYPQIRDREQLLGDLSAALETVAALHLFFIFRLSRSDEPEARPPNATAEPLLAEAAAGLAGAIGPSASLYRPRSNELCGLVPAPLLGVEEALVSVLAIHNDAHRLSGLVAGFGAVVLPREAQTTPDAMRLADQRLTGITGDALPRPAGLRPSGSRTL
jgi:hypothetical protein